MLFDLQKSVFLLKIYYKTASINAVQRTYQARPPQLQDFLRILCLDSKNTVRLLGKHRTADLPA